MSRRKTVELYNTSATVLAREGVAVKGEAEGVAGVGCQGEVRHKICSSLPVCKATTNNRDPHSSRSSPAKHSLQGLS